MEIDPMIVIKNKVISDICPQEYMKFLLEFRKIGIQLDEIALYVEDSLDKEDLIELIELDYPDEEITTINRSLEDTNIMTLYEQLTDSFYKKTSVDISLLSGIGEYLTDMNLNEVSPDYEAKFYSKKDLVFCSTDWDEVLTKSHFIDRALIRHH
jgi:hypothetical protein